nr:MAG: hypothetical protein [Chiromantes dehaani nimavirus]
MHGATETTSLPPQNEKEKVIMNLKDSIKKQEGNILSLKQIGNQEGSILSLKQIGDFVEYKDQILEDEEKSLSGLRKALDLVLNLPPSAYLKIANFREDPQKTSVNHIKECSILVLAEKISYDVICVMEKWECMLFRYVSQSAIRSGYCWHVIWYTMCVEDVTDITRILVSCVTIQRWWTKILYEPEYFITTSIFSKAKRNFDTLLKTHITTEAPAEESAEAEENSDHDQEPSPLVKRALQQPFSSQEQQIVVISAKKTPVCLLKRRRCDTAQDDLLCTRGKKNRQR